MRGINIRAINILMFLTALFPAASIGWVSQSRGFWERESWYAMASIFILAIFMGGSLSVLRNLTTQLNELQSQLGSKAENQSAT